MFSLDGYKAVTANGGVVRRADRGVLAVSGTDRAAWLQGLLTNDVAALEEGKAQYAAYLTPQGRMITDMHVMAAGDRILIDVCDHCGGLPPGLAAQLFLPFVQAGADKSGLGLGLSICRRSVDANDGILSVRDVPGSGCIFTIDLPRHRLSTANS